ncbi:sn-glycerol 3-phosphate transport system permease protein [Paenibacillus sp. LBL]|uniref:carbohydrate ABC transporter permease n=1 Tax=Paenibacillus sp. LBL TaxID=2940563 RepID=UPI0024771A88|nr:sugar ABC transporter permease [Paenibacillus sp. LBL]MDH6670672.1 sn-glycerol 3-phosphate transport system permease protein [Paenibacillus sp. LBL]
MSSSVRSTLKENGFAWLLLLPSLVFLALFTLYPMWKTGKISFYQSDLATPIPTFTGWDNYSRMLDDSVFRQVIGNNLWFALATVPASILLGMVMAIFADKAIHAKSWVRVSFFYPNLIPMIAAANVWLFIYTPQYGLLSRITVWFNAEGMNLLGNPDTVMGALAFMMIWKEAGYFMIFYLAGLQNIPKDLYESANVDGVSRFVVFRRITFPLLMPTTLFVMIIALTNSFKLVDHLWIMTKGGPDNSSSLLLFYIFETAFSFYDQGMAGALTAVMIGILLILSCAQFFGLDKRIHYR